jgi:DDE superfamily endonuclease
MPHTAGDDQTESIISAAEVARYCQYFFASLPRADQRRWAEVFIRGLLTVPGRKTIRKISDQVSGGGAEQCLQQFVNQSTWRWDEVRRDLALLLCEAMRPKTWVIRDVVMPKNGANSVGVDAQFAPPEGRVLNCQLGIAVFLAGDTWSCPVNWRLCLPPCWDSDKKRRKKAHVPDEERCSPRWQHMLDAIDEMSAEWGLSPAPILADVSHEREQDVDSLLRGLGERSVPYVLRVGANRPAVTIAPANAKPRTLSYAQVLAESVSRNTTTLNRWHLPSGRPGRSQLIAARVPLNVQHLSAQQRPPPGRHPHQHQRPYTPFPPLRSTRPLHVVADWSPVRKSPRSTWLTSFDPPRLLSMPEEVARHDRTAVDLAHMYDGLGLRHFEGRSYQGWHHYVTLVSAAAACQQLRHLV